MIVISDTSVICNLFLIDKLGLLPLIFKEIVIPPKVYDELIELKNFDIDISPILTADFITIKSPDNQVFITKLMTQLDAGEAEAIALAIELKADILLIDEMKGRTIAEELGIEITGILGILLRAKKLNLVSEIRPILNALINEANFFIGKKLYNLILSKAGE